FGEIAASLRPLDEIAQHALGDLEVGDHPVFEGADRDDVAGCAADHALGLDTHGHDLLGGGVDGHDRRLVEHDAAAADIHQCVGGAEVDRHVTAEKGELATHGERSLPVTFA